MKPGRELNALIAEKVMGLKLDRGYDGKHPVCVVVSEEPYRLNSPAPYSTQITAAFEVVGKVQQKLNCDFKISRMWWGKLCEFTAGFGALATGHGACESLERASAESAPHAICLASLKMVDSKKIGLTDS